MRAIVINSRNRTVVEIDLVPTLDRLQQIVGGLIEPVEQGLDDEHHCYVNEEGLLDKPAAFLHVHRRASAGRRQWQSSSPRPRTVTRRRAACRSIGSKSA